MGAISFSLDVNLALLMQRELRCTTFFESGGFQGDTIARVEALFERVISVEVAPTYAQGLRTRFSNSKNVAIIEGDSAATLEKIKPELSAAHTLYWLDAHWCDANAVDAAIHQCPLLRELRALGSLNEHSAVIVDDARLFLAPPLAPHEVSDWPTWSQILRTIEASSGSTHDIMVVNDCIVVFPRVMQTAMAEYAQNSGADWLKIADLSREHGVILSAAEDRLKLINELHNANAQNNDRIQQLLESTAKSVAENISLTESLHALRLDFDAEEVALTAAHQTAAKSLAENRVLTERLYVVQSELQAKEGVIQGMAGASIYVNERMRVLLTKHETANADLCAKEEVIFEIEQRRVEQERQLASATAKAVAAEHKFHALQTVELSAQEQLAVLNANLSERDTEIRLVREQSLQLREEDLSRRLETASQIALFQQTVHELRVNVASLHAVAAARESVMEAAADAFGVADAANTASLEPAARALLSASTKHWQQQAVEKEAVIQELVTAIAAHREAVERRSLPVRMWQQGKLGVQNAIKPKLGVLNQHSPIPLGDRTIPLRRALLPEQLPRISIVTPSFRQAHLIERTIASVVAQAYPKLEYFIQDGGSDDGTTSVLEKWSDRLSGWESKRDGGQSAAINLGFAKTSGDIMAWLNSDDLLMPGSLNYVAAYFQRHPEVDVIYGDRLLIDENDALIGRWVLPGHVDAVLPWADFVPQETLFWRRNLWDKVGAHIDETFKFAMDWDLLLRFRKAGARFAHVPKYLGAFRIHASQKTSAAISDIGFQEMDRLRLRELGRVVSHHEIRRAIKPFMARHIVADKLASLR